MWYSINLNWNCYLVCTSLNLSQTILTHRLGQVMEKTLRVQYTTKFKSIHNKINYATNKYYEINYLLLQLHHYTYLTSCSIPYKHISFYFPYVKTTLCRLRSLTNTTTKTSLIKFNKIYKLNDNAEQTCLTAWFNITRFHVRRKQNLLKN